MKFKDIHQILLKLIETQHKYMIKEILEYNKIGNRIIKNRKIKFH